MPIRKYFNRRKIKKDSHNREEVLRLLVMFFGSARKAEIWMKSENPLLGCVTPESMLANGRSDRLLDFIKNAMDDNGWGDGK